MKSGDPVADEILNRTLLEASRVRARRRAGKGAFAVMFVLAAGASLWPRNERTESQERRGLATEENFPVLPKVADERIAVMVWRGGTPCLEWVGLRDVGLLELELSLEPVIAFADDGM